MPPTCPYCRLPLRSMLSAGAVAARVAEAFVPDDAPEPRCRHRIHRNGAASRQCRRRAYLERCTGCGFPFCFDHLTECFECGEGDALCDLCVHICSSCETTGCAVCAEAGELAGARWTCRGCVEVREEEKMEELQRKQKEMEELQRKQRKQALEARKQEAIAIWRKGKAARTAVAKETHQQYDAILAAVREQLAEENRQALGLNAPRSRHGSAIGSGGSAIGSGRRRVDTRPQPEAPVSAPARGQGGISAAVAATAADDSQNKFPDDTQREFTCTWCAEAFIVTSADRDKLRAKGITSLPAQCKPCRMGRGPGPSAASAASAAPLCERKRPASSTTTTSSSGLPRIPRKKK